MISEPPHYTVLCNHADSRSGLEETPQHKVLRLEYDGEAPSMQNVKVSLLRFIQDVNHLPPRLQDLLEIAAYVFCADRSFSRGRRDGIEHHSWSRDLHFIIKVRDVSFWQDPAVLQALSEALTFMSGDEDYTFTFQGGRASSAVSMFDDETFLTEPNHPATIALFSGGLDSVSGIVNELVSSDERHVYLVSHRSNQPSTTKTQDAVVHRLRDLYGKYRVRHYKFYCSFRGVRARDENQRTRAFLYSSIAYALASVLLRSEFTVFENGVTAINFPKREDMGSARASRTTHPKTIRLLERLFSLIRGSEFKIRTPLLWKTKADVFRSLSQDGRADLISTTVSCSKTFKNTETYTHCGECSQCVDRRLAGYSSGLNPFDHAGLYTRDFVTQPLVPESRTVVVDYIRWASYFHTCSVDSFCRRLINELVDVSEYLEMPDDEAIERLYGLHKRHGQEVQQALSRMLSEHYSYSIPTAKGSLLQLVLSEEHLKEPVQRFVDDVCRTLSTAIPKMFRKNPPSNEPDLNDKISGVLAASENRFAREHPAVSFALAKAVPDHSSKDHDVLIETKYIRAATTPSVASEGIAADLTKYPSESYLLFVIYDPDYAISDDQTYRQDFENKRPGRCAVLVLHR